MNDSLIDLRAEQPARQPADAAPAPAEVALDAQRMKRSRMIPASPATRQHSGWQAALRESISDPEQLLAELGLPELAHRLRADDHRHFPLRVPRGYVARMRFGDPADPLLRQVLPLDEERRRLPGFTLDAVGDLAARGASGVLYKYAGRALLVSTGSCAIHCRYCFRQHFPYADENPAREHWRGTLDWLDRHREVDELILSGGDPLTLSTARLARLTDALRQRPWIRRLRLHTRLPVVLPERIDDEFLDWSRGLHIPVVTVIHANHANELDASTAAALEALAGAGHRLLNQSVLLAGVNDAVDALVALSQRLFEQGVLPYYLHQLDRVHGTAHFEVDPARALALHEAMAVRLPGYLVPRLVREQAGAARKLPLQRSGMPE